MVITISNTDDFIRALRGNEEFQAAARRELLTQDLLELPAVVLDDRMNSDSLLLPVQARRLSNLVFPQLISSSEPRPKAWV